jgi:hypothetical protein
MTESEISNAPDAAFYIANEVINEYHGIPVVNRADIGSPSTLFLQLNGTWFRFEASEVTGPETIGYLEHLAG